MIFVVEDDTLIRTSLAQFLEAAGHEVEAFGDAESALLAAKKAPPDVALCDLQLPGMGGLELIEELQKIDAGTIRLVMTAHASVASALRAMRSGCYDYLEKPVDLERILRLVERALLERRSGVELNWHRQRANEIDADFLGESEPMQALKAQIAALAKLKGEAPTVLIMGETGVGKGVVARAIHRARFGANAPIIEVNCAALPATLIEAELFGYERSAFTDAKQAKPGLFEAATGGTLFLDEIGELPLETQSKLLSAAETGRVRRLGAVRDVQTSASIITATNVYLPKAVAAGRFRADLYHRLAAFTLTVPPLRARPGDAVVLARAFVLTGARRYHKAVASLSADAVTWIQEARWPGNVRELKFAVERAVLLAPDDVRELTRAHLLLGTALDAEAQGVSTGLGAANSLPPGAVIDASNQGLVAVRLPPDGISFDDLERAVLTEAMRLADGNVVRAAKLLGFKRDAMRYRIRRLGVGDDVDDES